MTTPMQDWEHSDPADQPLVDVVDDGPEWDPGWAGAEYEQMQVDRYGDEDEEPQPQGYDDNRWHGPKDAWDYDYHPRDPEPDRGPEQELGDDEPGDHR